MISSTRIHLLYIKGELSWPVPPGVPLSRIPGFRTRLSASGPSQRTMTKHVEKAMSHAVSVTVQNCAFRSNRGIQTSRGYRNDQLDLAEQSEMDVRKAELLAREGALTGIYAISNKLWPLENQP